MKIRQRNSLRFIKRFVSINSLLPSLKLNCMRATTCHRIQSIFSLVLRHKMKRISNFSYFEQFFFSSLNVNIKLEFYAHKRKNFFVVKKTTTCKWKNSMQNTNNNINKKKRQHKYTQHKNQMWWIVWWKYGT